MRRGLWLAMALVLVIASLPSMAPATETAPPADDAPTATTTTTTSSTTVATTTTTVADTGVFEALPAIGISTDSLIVRDKPAADGTYIGGLAPGSDVLVYAKEGGWYRIRYNSADVGWTQQAYVNADYIVPVEDAPPVVTTTKTTTTTKKAGATTTTAKNPVTTTTGNVSGDRGVATGSFVWPVPGWKRITQGYHGGHKAIDVYENAMLGSPIVAVDGGTVVMCKTSGYNNGAGIYIQIDHGNGYKSHYCHCSKILFKKGDKIAKGEVIGYVGQTGNTSGPGLHLEMWKNGVYINPLSVLPY